ncbi:hypothetical protein JM654_13665 [Microbacterium oxydans]|nr:hypothetical protein [Microbacterium oxydans]
MTSSVSPRLRALIASTAAVVFAASLLLASPATAAGGGDPAAGAAASAPEATDIVKTADLSLFRPGNIIADAVFFNAVTMNAGQIDSFLRSKVSSCRAGYVCLKDYRQNTPTRPADAYCNGYAGAGNESAATIIDKVSKSCGINPQVLIVMLQKEQGLVTDSYPPAGRFNIAMGQGCPDTAGCDPAYSGFFYQVYGAARQMKIYAEGRWFTYYAPGRTWNILYHPEPKRNCGSAPVYIENTATAALYYYTPYQPNRAALNAGYGEGDGCSAYGNRNFYQYFTDWFGSTQRVTSVIVRGDGPEVYLLSGGYRFHIKTAEDLRAFSAKLGAVSQVPASYLKTIPLGSQISRYVHDAREGILYLIDPDGTRHRFGSEKQILDFGYAFRFLRESRARDHRRVPPRRGCREPLPRRRRRPDLLARQRTEEICPQRRDLAIPLRGQARLRGLDGSERGGEVPAGARCPHAAVDGARGRQAGRVPRDSGHDAHPHPPASNSARRSARRPRSPCSRPGRSPVTPPRPRRCLRSSRATRRRMSSRAPACSGSPATSRRHDSPPRPSRPRTAPRSPRTTRRPPSRSSSAPTNGARCTVCSTASCSTSRRTRTWSPSREAPSAWSGGRTPPWACSASPSR